MNTSEWRVRSLTVGESLEEHETNQDLKSSLNALQLRQRQRLEESVEDLNTFFGEEADRLTTLSLEVNINDFLMAQRALAGLLDGWRVERECRYNKRAPALIQRYAVKVSYEQYDFVVEHGRQFWLGPEGERMAVDLAVHDADRRMPYSEIIFRLPEHRHAWLVELIPKLQKWKDANHFMRGQAVAATGKFLKLDDDITWENVFLPPDVRESIERNCIQLLQYSDLYKANGLPLMRGILLHGPPGTGKTMIGKALARICGVTFILVTPGMLDEAEDVRQVFSWGRHFAPSILFFEDFDMVARNRDAIDSPKKLLGEFLSGLDGLEESRGVIAIATTNDLKVIEPALKDRPNRFDCVLEIPPMRKEERRLFFEKWVHEINGTIDPEMLAARTKDFTGAQLQEVCRLAVLEAVAERISQNRTETDKVSINERCIEAAFRKIGKKPRRSIGFVAEDTC